MMSMYSRICFIIIELDRRLRWNQILGFSNKSLNLIKEIGLGYDGSVCLYYSDYV